MSKRERRQSWRRTRRQLNKSLSRHGRKWVKEVWQASTRTAAELDGLSPLTTPVARRLVESYATREHADGPEIQHPLRVAVVYGYTARMVLFDSTDQPSLRPAAFNLRHSPTWSDSPATTRRPSGCSTPYGPSPRSDSIR